MQLTTWHNLKLKKDLWFQSINFSYNSSSKIFIQQMWYDQDSRAEISPINCQRLFVRNLRCVEETEKEDDWERLATRRGDENFILGLGGCCVWACQNWACVFETYFFLYPHSFLLHSHFRISFCPHNFKFPKNDARIRDVEGYTVVIMDH